MTRTRMSSSRIGGVKGLLLGLGALSMLGLTISSTSGWAASAYKNSLDGKHNAYLKQGVFTGGQAGQGASLLAVRKSYSAKLNLERIIFDMGDREAKPAGKALGYFQATIDGTNKRIVLDISQLRLSRVSETQVERLFRKDPYVASVSLTLDPEDKAGTLVLNLKRPMKLEVFQLRKAKKAGRIVMDLTPLKVGTL